MMRKIAKKIVAGFCLKKLGWWCLLYTEIPKYKPKTGFGLIEKKKKKKIGREVGVYDDVGYVFANFGDGGI